MLVFKFVIFVFPSDI